MERFRLRYLISIAQLLGGNLQRIIVFSFILPLIGCAINKGKEVNREVFMDRTTFSVEKDKYPDGHSFDIFPEYRIAPGDVLDVLFQIRTWVEKKEFKLTLDNTVSVKFVYAPELNETQIVRPDGNISLPYLGEVHVIGRTVAELTEELQDRYRKILQNPTLYIVVAEFRSAIKELKADLHTAPRGLSRLATVRPDGYVTFPMVGDMMVANKTIPEVNQTLNEMYEKILSGLHCDLFLERHAGSVIYVLGEVKSPGAYNIVKPISVVEALTLGGSYLPGAKLDSVIVIRRHGDRIIATRLDLESTLSLKAERKLFYLEPDDIVYVPRTWISKTAEIMRGIADIIFFRGWSVGFSWELHNEPTEQKRRGERR